MRELHKCGKGVSFLGHSDASSIHTVTEETQPPARAFQAFGYQTAQMRLETQQHIAEGYSKRLEAAACTRANQSLCLLLTKVVILRPKMDDKRRIALLAR